jgi:hypothetical protein
MYTLKGRTERSSIGPWLWPDDGRALRQNPSATAEVARKLRSFANVIVKPGCLWSEDRHGRSRAFSLTYPTQIGLT